MAINNRKRIGCYSRLLTRWPHIILPTVVLVVVVCGVLAGFVIPFPAFQNPIKGFEARGTKIKGQEQIVLKLQHPSRYDLSVVPPVYFDREIFKSSSSIGPYLVYIMDRLNISLDLFQKPKKDKKFEPASSASLYSNAVPGSEKFPSALSSSDGSEIICLNSSFETTSPKIVFESQSGENLLTVSSIRAMCILEKKLTNFLKPENCPHRNSLTYHMERQSGKRCEDLEQYDIDVLLATLRLCVPYFENQQLREFCDEETCLYIPYECRQGKSVYSIFQYLTDKKFFKRLDNNRYNENLTYALLSVTNLYMGYKKYYRDHVEKITLEEGDVAVVAVDTRVKFDLFNDYVLDDIVLFAVAMSFILVAVLLYLRSFVVTFATIANVIFTLIVSYTLYHTVLNIKHFPFINILTGLICIAISADDVFIFYDTWNQMKAEHPDASIQYWMSKTFSHAAVSVFVTSLTTASAFFANVVSEITDIKCFGIFSGLSIMVNFVLMITWIPATVALLEKNSGKCCGQKTNADLCSFLDPFIKQVSKIKVVFEKFLPLVVIKSWFVWLFVLISLGAGGIVIVFVTPRLDLPTSPEFQVYQSSDPMEVWDFEIKDMFRFVAHDKNDITTTGLPVSIVCGFNPNDNGDSLNPDDMGSLSYDDKFNITTRDAQIWMGNVCMAFKNFSRTDPSMQAIPCSITVFNDMMQLPCGDYRISPCCGNTLKPPYPEFLFKECFPKLIATYQFILHRFGKNLPPFFSIGTPFYANKTENEIKGFSLTVTGTQAWSPVLGKMEVFHNDLEAFMKNQTATAPLGVNQCFITSAFKFYDLQRALSYGTYYAIGMSVAVAFLVMLVTSLNLLITIYALLTIALSISVTVGALVLLGWKLNILESITISLAVGLSIDFSIHYGVAYRLSCHEDRADKVRESFVRVGSSIAMAAFTTFIAGAAMMPAKILAYTQLGVFLMLVMTISWSYATLLFQSLCRVIGPRKTVNSFKCCRKSDKHTINGEYSTGFDPANRNMDELCVMNSTYSQEKTSNDIMLNETKSPSLNHINGNAFIHKDYKPIANGVNKENHISSSPNGHSFVDRNH